MPEKQIVTPAGISDPLVPRRFQFYAHEHYAMYQRFKTEDAGPQARLLVFCRSIQLAAKALHLAHRGTDQDWIEDRRDLGKALNAATLSAFGIILTPAETTEFSKASAYYKRLHVSPEITGPERALIPWPDLPDEEVLDVLFQRLVAPKL